MTRANVADSARGGIGGQARVESVDIVRGVIMIIMALDHTRDFCGIPGKKSH